MTFNINGVGDSLGFSWQFLMNLFYTAMARWISKAVFLSPLVFLLPLQILLDITWLSLPVVLWKGALVCKKLACFLVGGFSRKCKYKSIPPRNTEAGFTYQFLPSGIFALPGGNARIPADKNFISVKSVENLKSPEVQTTFEPSSVNEGKVLFCHRLISWNLLFHKSDLSLLFKKSWLK